MMLLDEIEQCRGTPSPTARSVHIPQTRPSFLDPQLHSEPWIDACSCQDTLVLFLLNRPIALMPGSSLDHVSLNTLLNQLRHRNPRRKSA